ncbi:hypothetical protein [Deinococcus maricopensis]|uniref:Uncharacterized protein n=1 Tax=Deinococcus maricopensis (strain DSM 21211 / LMG 22137 / NRRL B-23946 / LB-34) TaxID=709986 RepID=E8U579_DEIML|nr:hypothetical protein [Deinococcus maricopensis]ADV66218.1 hypothetical protein Deima_0559 [Deinococcus maricopensis DSM 21211]
MHTLNQRTLECIAETIRTGQAHHTVVLNTLIETENQGGSGALRQLERQLSRSADALQTRQHPHTHVARTWLDATRAYLLVNATRKQAV